MGGQMAEAEDGFTNPILVGAEKSSVCTYEEQGCLAEHLCVHLALCRSFLVLNSTRWPAKWHPS